MRVAASLAGRMEEDVLEVSMVDMAQPCAAATSQAETTQPKLSSVQVAVSVVGQMEEGAPKESLSDVVMGQAFASTSPTPSTTRGSTLEELLPQEGSTPLGFSAEPSRSMV